MEMLNTNLVVSNEYDNREKARKSRPTKGGQKSNHNNSKARRVQKSQSNRFDDAYHYVAYVPISSDVWRLDGLQKCPVNIGKSACSHREKRH
jgi:ubiquitin carboxyl-terminal hydrolase L5